MTEDSELVDLFFDIIENGDFVRLRELLEQQGGVHCVDAALAHMAVLNRRPDVLDWTLSQGFDPNQSDRRYPWYENTPLFWATFMKEREMMELLIQYGAKVSAELEQDETSLHLAAADGDVDGLTLLLEHADGRAALEAADYLRRTPLQCAVESLHLWAIRVLLEAGADCDNLEEKVENGPSLLALLQAAELERRGPCPGE